MVAERVLADEESVSFVSDSCGDDEIVRAVCMDEGGKPGKGPAEKCRARYDEVTDRGRWLSYPTCGSAGPLEV